jgi:GDP-4-dehydro-6-deoxy-D-mannose reductase
MNVLVTGIAGFVGGHLVDLLRAESPEARIFGLVRPKWPIPPGLPEKAMLIDCELEDAHSVEAAVGALTPDRVIHLAAQSSPQQSWNDPAGTVRSNVLGLLHLLEVFRGRGMAPRVLVVGSAEEYGHADESDLPLREDAPLRPNNPYATSKVAQGFLALQYALGVKMPIIRTRTFHHTGPGRGAAFAEGSFARQIAEIEAGLRPPVVSVGNLDAVRDFSDVRDVVRAYWLLSGRGQAGEVYNVCSGRGTRIREILDGLIAASDVPIQVHVDPERLRPLDVPAIVGDPSRLRRATGWVPRIALDVSLRDLLADARARVGGRPLVESGPAPCAPHGLDVGVR